MGPQRVLTLRRGLRDAGLRHLSWSASNLYFRSSTLQSGKKSISMAAPGKGYGIRFSSVASRLLLLLKKPRRRVERVREGSKEMGRAKWHLGDGRLSIYSSAGTVQKSHVPICPFAHNTFSFSPLLSSPLSFIEYSIFFLSPSFNPLWFSFHWDARSARVELFPSPALGRTWLGPS